MKKYLQIILNILIIGIVILWGALLFTEFNSLPKDNENIVFTIFNIKTLLFALFFIVAVSSAFYINLISINKGRSSKAESPNLRNYAVNEQNLKIGDDLDLIANLEATRKLLSSNLQYIDQIMEKYSNKREDGQFDDNKTEKTLLNQLAIQSKLMKISNIIDLFSELVDIASETTAAQRVSLFLYNAEKENLAMFKEIGFDKKEEDAQIEIGIDEGVAGYAFKNGKRIYVTNVETHPQLKRQNKLQYKTKSFIIFPIKLFTDDITIGVLNLTEKKDENGIFSMADLEKMNILMKSLSLKFENMILRDYINKSEKSG